MTKFVIAFATVALAFASAANNRYTVQISSPSEVGGQVIKPGSYTVEMKDNRAVLKSGKEVIEVNARVENQDKKYSDTSIRYTGDEANKKIDEIRIGGTTTKIVFAKTQAAGN